MSIQDTVRSHFETREPLEIRGGGTRRFLGHVGDFAVVDTAGEVGIIEYDPRELVVRVRAGTRLEQLSAVLSAEDQRLAFEPPDIDGRSTIGGAIACGWSGPGRPFFGSARDFVLGVCIVTGEGKRMEFGGQVMKNVAGFDVSRLVTGSMGTLGVIVDISLKVLPAPELEITRSFAMPRDGAHERMLSLSRRSLPVSALAWTDGRLAVRLSGTEAGVKAAARELGGDEAEAGVWSRLSTLEMFSGATRLWRISVPASCPALLDEAVVIDWGGSQRWVVDPAFDPRDRLPAGHATLIWDQGQGTLPRFHPLPAPLVALHRRLKDAFDPRGILNPDRMYAGI